MSDGAIILGPYRQGEIPELITYTFELNDGTPDPLAGYQAKFEYWRWGVFVPVELSATVLDQGAFPGNVQWAFGSSDMLNFGDFEGELWVGNGTNRYRSQMFRWVVTPTVQVPNI